MPSDNGRWRAEWERGREERAQSACESCADSDNGELYRYAAARESRFSWRKSIVSDGSLFARGILEPALNNARVFVPQEQQKHGLSPNQFAVACLCVGVTQLAKYVKLLHFFPQPVTNTLEKPPTKVLRASLVSFFL